VLVCVSPTEAETRELLEVHKLDPHTLQSALDPDEQGRVEFEEDHLALIIRRPCSYTSADNYLFKVMSAGVFLFKDKLIIVMAKDVPLFEGKQSVKLVSLHDVLLKLLRVVINHFMGHLRVINLISDELEQKASHSAENKHLLNMFTLEKSLVYFLNALNDNGTVATKLKNSAAKIGFSTDHVELLDDIAIDNAQCLTLAQTYSNILSSLMDARASLVSNNLNVMMKNLNALVIAVAVPSFFAAVGGMSEFTQMAGPERWYVAYPVFLGAMGGLGALTYWIVKRLERH
ncbi:MAG TPA: magnesium transporter CorA family protein, partial [Myxococcota bacterium]|nr:magnesium transporter CorA family protein [Myxococcota bacterium]